MKKLKKATAVLLLCIILAGLCTVSGSASDFSVAPFVIVIGDSAIAGCRENSSALDTYLADSEHSSFAPLLCFDADNLTYNEDFISAVLKLKVLGYPILQISENPDNALLFCRYIRHITKKGTPYLLDISGQFTDNSAFARIPCCGKVQTYAEFLLLTGDSEDACIAMELLNSNFYGIQLAINYYTKNNSVPAGLHELLSLA